MSDEQNTKIDGLGLAKNRLTGTLGASDESRRKAILQAASEHVHHYGYQKTTVADIAKAVHVSTAYLYRFFESKQAIGEAVCTQLLQSVMTELADELTRIDSASESIAFIFRYLASTSMSLYSQDRKMHDLVALSFQERWTSPETYNVALKDVVRQVVLRGRERGEFERKTSLDEICEAIRYTTQPFFHPSLLDQDPSELREEAQAVGNLVQRSLMA
jgi:AcrR family transcriptional regulator